MTQQFTPTSSFSYHLQHTSTIPLQQLQTTQTLLLDTHNTSSNTTTFFPLKDYKSMLQSNNLLLTSKEIDEYISRSERIGEGSFGVVFQASISARENAFQHRNIAIKKLKNQNLTKDEERQFYTEMIVLSELKHPNIVAFYKACIEVPCLSIITEYVSRGTLKKYLGETIHVSLLHVLNIMKQISEGMKYLHSHDPVILHLDLKSDNILVNQNNEIKITDFGLSFFIVKEKEKKEKQNENEIENENENELKEKEKEKDCKDGKDTNHLQSSNVLQHAEKPNYNFRKQQKMNQKNHTIRGTPGYCSPESVDGKLFTMLQIEDKKKADVFSFGIVFWEVINKVYTNTYSPPYHEYPHLIDNPLGLMNQVSSDEVMLRPTIPRICDPTVATVIKQCYAHHYESRLNFDEINDLLREFVDILIRNKTQDLSSAMKLMTPLNKMHFRKPTGNALSFKEMIYNRKCIVLNEYRNECKSGRKTEIKENKEMKECKEIKQPKELKEIKEMKVNRKTVQKSTISPMTRMSQLSRYSTPFHSTRTSQQSTQSNQLTPIHHTQQINQLNQINQRSLISPITPNQHHRESNQTHLFQLKQPKEKQRLLRVFNCTLSLFNGDINVLPIRNAQIKILIETIYQLSIQFKFQNHSKTEIYKIEIPWNCFKNFGVFSERSELIGILQLQNNPIWFMNNHQMEYPQFIFDQFSIIFQNGDVLNDFMTTLGEIAKRRKIPGKYMLMIMEKCRAVGFRKVVETNINRKLFEDQ